MCAQRGTLGGKGSNDIPDAGPSAGAAQAVELVVAKIAAGDQRQRPLVSENANLRMLTNMTLTDGARVVGARVVEDHEFDVATALRQHAFDAFAQKIAAAIDRRGDPYARRRNACTS
jgi:hypothetical protein